MNKLVNKSIWFFPVLIGLMVLGMDPDVGHTDLRGQISVLLFSENVDIARLLFDTSLRCHGAYVALYSILHKIFGMTPQLYIALVSFSYCALVIIIAQSYIKSRNYNFINSNDGTKIVLVALLSFCPILFCIARNLFAIDLLLIGILFLIHKKYILSIFSIIVAVNSHEGILLMIAVLLVSALLKYLVLPKFKSILSRNLFIIVCSFLLVLIGPIIFHYVGDILSENNIIGEYYFESYVEATAGDGAYKFVIVLSMVGTLCALIISSISNSSNNWANVVCIASFFAVCLFFNQKIFYVQRIVMFAPTFIGLSLLDLYEGHRIHVKSLNIYTVCLASVPLVYLAQLFFQKSILLPFIFK